MKFYNINLFLITKRPWPLIFSITLIFIAINLVRFLFLKRSFLFNVLINFRLILLIFFCWWNDLIRESINIGIHNIYIIFFTINRIIIFIISEIFFFICFFWSFFHFILSPDIIIGSIWPPIGIFKINYINLPLLNSILLIRRGCSVTWSHYIIIGNNIKESKIRLLITIILGIIFLFCQLFEYKYSIFNFSDSVYGSIFFIATGFHGIHVIIGDIFLISILIRIIKFHFSSNHIIGFEFSIWYWHFVDVVWLYLYIMVYWLRS
jgi:heme/copper-type cytochrome/quinol oxidase subunit 3